MSRCMEKNLFLKKIFKHMRLTFYKYLALLIISFSSCKQASEDYIIYEIRPTSIIDRVNLDITLKLKGDTSGLTVVTLPVDKYGTKNIYESISSFHVKNAQTSTVFEKPFVRKIHHDPGQKLEINYTISFDPEMSTTSSFSPIVEESLFHFFYPQWTLRVEGDSALHNYKIEFKDVPSNWVAYSNLKQTKPGVFETTSTQESFKPFIAGGDYDHYAVEVAGNPVNVIISYHFREEDLLSDVQTILDYQRNLFDFDNNEHFLVSITNREGILAGTGIENAFVALMRTGANRFEVLQLLAHETMHNWIPLMADIARDEEEVGSEYQTEFFNEGITSYAPKVLLYDQDLIKQSEVVAMLNETLEDYAKNPYSNITLKDIQKAEADGIFNNLHEKIAYHRGELIGFRWDNIIRKNTNDKENILHFLKKVIAKALETDGKVSFEDFFQIASNYGINAKKDWESYILEGETVKINDLGWLDSDYQIVEETGTFYEAGFNYRASKRKGNVEQLIKGSAAEKAGLMEGMQIVEIQASRSKNEPFVIKVIDGTEEKIISYLPTKEVTYQKIVEKKQ